MHGLCLRRLPEDARRGPVRATLGVNPNPNPSPTLALNLARCVRHFELIRRHERRPEASRDGTTDSVDYRQLYFRATSKIEVSLTLTRTLTPHPHPNPNPHPSPEPEPSPSPSPSPLTLTLTLTLTRSPARASRRTSSGTICSTAEDGSTRKTSRRPRLSSCWLAARRA